MGWKSYIPYHGDRSVRKKLRELDEAGIGVPMFVLLFFQKSIEIFIVDIGDILPVPLWTVFFTASAIVFIAWVYDKELKNKGKKAKEKIQE